MDCNKCKSSNSQEIEQLINDLVEYLTHKGVSTESMIASLIEIDAKAKYLTPPPTPFRKEGEYSNEIQTEERME